MTLSRVFPIHVLIIALAVSGLLVGCLASSSSTDPPPINDSIVGPDYTVEVVVAGLQNPWGMALLPGDGDRALVTERAGRLNLVDLVTGSIAQVTGLPAIAVVGQGGLLDVALYPDYGAGQEWVYLTYAAANPDNANQYATHEGRAA